MGSTALATGLAMLPVTVVTGADGVYQRTTRSTRFGEWPVMRAGLAAGAVGAVLVGLAATDGQVWPLALAASRSA